MQIWLTLRLHIIFWTVSSVVTLLAKSKSHDIRNFLDTEVLDTFNNIKAPETSIQIARDMATPRPLEYDHKISECNSQKLEYLDDSSSHESHLLCPVKGFCADRDKMVFILSRVPAASHHQPTHRVHRAGGGLVRCV